ncbi:PH domain-containing protein (plasmid) [Streptomyces sp. BI20]|uniref:PH domain-containing protein n=1 Tax=Streptomyces sp. BI20 TaxID=3403460 RepID=UPI003C72778F
MSPRPPGPARRTALPLCAPVAAPLGPLLLGLALDLGPPPAVTRALVATLLLAFAAAIALTALRLDRTRYRLTGDALVVRSGLLARRERTLPLRRIRGVDLTAPPGHRLLGLTVLRVTGDTDTTGARLVLNALPTPAAHRLRDALLAGADPDRPAPTGDLARFTWRGALWAPLTFWLPGGILIAAGTAARIADTLDYPWWRAEALHRLTASLGPDPAGPAALLGLLALLALGTLGALGAIALHVENWWGLRTAWTGPDTLTVRRGLLTTRRADIERSRLHGALLREPLPLRAAGGARPTLIAAGLGGPDEAHARGALAPPGPRAEALRLLGEVLNTPALTTPLRPAPPAARLRRRRRALHAALWPALPALALAAATGHPGWAWAAGGWTALGGGCAWLLARDAHRSLGHALHGPYLVARAGTLGRDTLVLDRSAVLAWTFTSSPGGRRAGLTTLTAAVAAGRHGYAIRDLDAREAPLFAARARPGILEEFLDPPEPEPAPAPEPTTGPPRPARDATDRPVRHSR